jgi:inorganic pyrophosphatase
MSGGAHGHHGGVSDQQQPPHVIVEIPKGSRNKYEYDHELRAIKLDRFLFSSVVYPTDYGFFPDTLAGDGDPLDAMVCVSEPTFPGCHIEVRIVGMLDMSDQDAADQKLLCVPCHDPNWSSISALDQLPEQLRAEIAEFFRVYKTLEEKSVEVHGWHDRDAALQALEDARARHAARAG